MKKDIIENDRNAPKDATIGVDSEGIPINISIIEIGYMKMNLISNPMNDMIIVKRSHLFMNLMSLNISSSRLRCTPNLPTARSAELLLSGRVTSYMI